MFSVKRYIAIISLFLLANSLQAQDLTGTWEGDLGTYQFLRLNIIQTGNKICGYTFDHLNADEDDHCKAFFEGYFDKKKQRLVITGKYFLENSGNHTLMKLKLDYRGSRSRELLEQAPRQVMNYRQRRSILGGIYIEPFVEDDSTEYVRIKKVSDQPYEITKLMQDCIAQDKVLERAFKPVVTPPAKDSIPELVNIPETKKPEDSLPMVKIPEPQKKDSVTESGVLTQRKNIEQSRLEVSVKTINLKVYDNAIVDGDTVSIFYNGKLLIAHQLLSEKPIEINLELDVKQTRHEIILFAENLGSIPPNTALIVITAGEKRYELFASASMEENAVLVFDYRPK
ncbi:MAG: hypothetical protein IPL84_11275 [Chitinophagaceae bacterium]|nr:hypothetical protein [Chitinophagaceae bacterium]